MPGGGTVRVVQPYGDGKLYNKFDRPIMLPASGRGGEQHMCGVHGGILPSMLVGGCVLVMSCGVQAI